MPTTSPSYSATDIGAAGATLVVVVLDILAGTGLVPILDPTLRAELMTSLTVLAVFGIGAYTANRSVKHVSLAKVAAAQAGAPVQVVAQPNSPFAGGSFVITPTPAEVKTAPVPPPPTGAPITP